MSRVNEIAQGMVVLWPKLMRSVRDPHLLHLNLTSSQVIILATLNDLKKCKISTLAKERGVSMPTISGMIDRLVKGKYVKRQRVETDRRTVMVSLTKKGERMINEILQVIRKRWQVMAAKLTPSEQQAYIKILAKLSKMLSEEIQSKR